MDASISATLAQQIYTFAFTGTNIVSITLMLGLGSIIPISIVFWSISTFRRMVGI